jgi:hypothetical protein
MTEKVGEIFAICLLIVLIGVAGTLDIVGYWEVFGPYPKPSVICKVCHCGKKVCSRVCSEETMCEMRCDAECKRRKQ